MSPSRVKVDRDRGVELLTTVPLAPRPCNVYFFHLAMRETLSLERMERVARTLGLGDRTGLGLNSEVKGLIPTEAFEAKEGTSSTTISEKPRKAELVLCACLNQWV